LAPTALARGEAARSKASNGEPYSRAKVVASCAVAFDWARARVQRERKAVRRRDGREEKGNMAGWSATGVKDS